MIFRTTSLIGSTSTKFELPPPTLKKVKMAVTKNSAENGEHKLR